MPLHHIVLHDFICASEQQQLRELALDYFARGILQANPRGPGRFRAKIWGTPHCTALIHAIGERIIARFNLAACAVDPELGWIISLLQPGAAIHPHFDRYPYHQQLHAKHLRCNVMVARENSSGNPVLGATALDVPERALWGFFPSDIQHSTHVISGSSPRIAYQFGFLVPQDYRWPSA